MQSKKSPSLEQVEQEFILWRQSRRSPREAIPEYLWAKAVQLYPAYTTSVIRERLKISGSQLKQQILKLEEPINSATDLKSNSFVIAQMPEDPAELKTELSRLPTLPEAFAQFTLKTSNRELNIKIPCDYLGQCFSHMAGLL